MASSDSKIVEVLPLKKAKVEYVAEFLSREEADELLEWSLKHIPFKSHDIKVYGKTFPQPRQTCLFGTGAYSYSGTTLKDSGKIPPELEKLIDRLMLLLPKEHRRFNAVLCNLYLNGDNYISPHSDNESDLLPGCSIAGLSVGAVRHFDLTSKKPDEEGNIEKHRVDLGHGSVVIMHYGCQLVYKHGVPVQKKIKEPRVNFTFRVMK